MEIRTNAETKTVTVTTDDGLLLVRGYDEVRIFDFLPVPFQIEVTLEGGTAG